MPADRGYPLGGCGLGGTGTGAGVGGSGRVDVVGIGALNPDCVASASRLSQRAAEQVSEGVARFERNTEGPVDSVTTAKAIERLGAASLDASLGGSAWPTLFTLARLRVGVRLGSVGVAGRIETPGLSFLRQMDELGIDRRFVTRHPALPAGVVPVVAGGCGAGAAHASAELKQRRRTPRHVSLGPGRIGDIARAALVLNGIRR
jgi:hypothetical protein